MPTTTSDYIRLTQVLITIAEANKASDVAPRMADAESLAVKFGAHCISVQYLSRGTRLPELRADFVDPASVNVVVRAAVESVLTFYYLYTAPTSDDERGLRHDSWVLADLMARQEFRPMSEENRQKLANERAQIERLQARLRANPAFSALTLKQQRGILEEQRWKLSGWGRIGRDMGLDSNHSEIFYSYLCSHSHSGYLSVLQVQQARTVEDQRTLIAGSIGALTVAIAHMIRLFAGIFPLAAEALRNVPNAEPLIQQWIMIGASTDEPNSSPEAA